MLYVLLLSIMLPGVQQPNHVFKEVSAAQCKKDLEAAFEAATKANIPVQLQCIEVEQAI